MSKKHTFNNIWLTGRVEFLTVLFCLSTRLFACGWCALVTRWMVPVLRRCNSAETLLTNSRPWSFIWMEKQPYLFSHKNCDTCLFNIKWFRFRPFAEGTMHRTNQQYPSTSGKLQISTTIWFITAVGAGVLYSSVFVFSATLPCFCLQHHAILNVKKIEQKFC